MLAFASGVCSAHRLPACEITSSGKGRTGYCIQIARTTLVAIGVPKRAAMNASMNSWMVLVGVVIRRSPSRLAQFS